MMTEKDFFQNSKRHVIKHLRNITNQEVEVPIPNNNDILVKNLINEVENETEIGITYINEWLDTISIIQDIRRKN